jgi:hypothetical protein
MATIAGVGGRWRSILLILGIIGIVLVLGGCASSGSKSAEPQTGSLVRTFTLMDEKGLNSGTLVINPIGDAELRDVNGNLIGTLVPQSPSSSGTVPQPEGEK